MWIEANLTIVMKNLVKIALFSAVLLFLPTFGMAAQKAITVSSLEKAYEGKVAELDAKIAAAQKNLDAIGGTTAWHSVPMSVFEKRMDQSAIINKAQDDKHILEVSHALLLEALK